MKRRRVDYYVKYKYEVDGKSYYHDMITEFKNWKMRLPYGTIRTIRNGM